MNCSKGICKYKTDNSNLCLRDKDNGHKPRKCDMVHTCINPPSHDCRYGSVTCEDCYAYGQCTET